MKLLVKFLPAMVVLCGATAAPAAVIYQESGQITQYGDNKQIAIPTLAPGDYRIYFSVDQTADLTGEVHAQLLPMDCYFGLGCSVNRVDRYYSTTTTGRGYSLAFSLAPPQNPCTPDAVQTYCTYVAGDIVADLLVSAYKPFSDTELGYKFILASAPEPAAWAMMIAGFGMAGSGVRRRKAKLALA